MSPELAAAIATIVQAWAPPPVPVGDPAESDDYDDWTNGCGCGGEDDDGDPVCNCADSCGCRSCDHRRHAETLRCHLRVPRDGQPYAWCGQPTRYRIVPFCVHRGGVTRSASDGDPEAERAMVRLGDSVQRHTATYACSTQHARELVEQDRQGRRGGPDSPLSAERTFYEVESWCYQPDEIDVTGALSQLPHLLGSARYWAEAAVRARFACGNVADAPGDVVHALDALRRNVAWTLGQLVEYEAERERAATDTEEPS